MKQILTVMEILPQDIYIRQYRVDDELGLFYDKQLMYIQQCSGKYAVMNTNSNRVLAIHDDINDCTKELPQIDYILDFMFETFDSYKDNTYYDYNLDKYTTCKSLDMILDEFRIINANKVEPLLSYIQALYTRIMFNFPEYRDRKKILKDYTYHIQDRLDEREYESVMSIVKKCKNGIKKHYPDEFNHIISQVGKDFDRLF